MQDSNTLKYAHTILHQKIYKISHHKCVGENERQVKKTKKVKLLCTKVHFCLYNCIIDQDTMTIKYKSFEVI